MIRVVERVQAEARRVEANVRYAMSVLLKDDRGDTNFVSILILLGIALALAALFMGFRDQVYNFVTSQMNSFTNSQNNLASVSRQTVTP